MRGEENERRGGNNGRRKIENRECEGREEGGKQRRERIKMNDNKVEMKALTKNAVID